MWSSNARTSSSWRRSIYRQTSRPMPEGWTPLNNLAWHLSLSEPLPAREEIHQRRGTDSQQIWKGSQGIVLSRLRASTSQRGHHVAMEPDPGECDNIFRGSRVWQC